ncbi:alkanesulfonate transporter substrate-binding subunit [Thalassovita gelatinovora]|uniref:Alkanesulfonate transporter substrate-binding subunit n=1 Tax=Thalassovita gelatinovora TaxID=53501 RepID=A0A0P1FXX6_THAGE|nr:PhnD/SsuA/transferrin family substrate-binding protein [Thalassovita gelatinovora]QIZ80058.1 PhnD/SsuA/transferrin family substrate-binding protein [Thalassovita gelatinovora]CUH65462.1 alkanesulfonate transporter substrate-binding subunit [Thalassovita gelatinovora]SER09283.1 phosphonate transport system substrate-binding protein [Thalassovita gelatinovora]
MIRSLFAAAALSLTAAPLFAETLKFAVTDIEGLEALQQEFGAFEEKLEDLSGHEVDLFPVSSRTAAVEALNQGKIDLVLTGPAEYVVINELTDAQIVTAWQRPNYYAQIVTLSDSPIKSVQDLKGKIVTFGSVGSTSQHLGPAQVLADFGLAYNADYQPQIISRNVAIEALIRGDVQAVGMNEGHLARIRKAFPDTSFTVIARGRDLPNDILVARSSLDDDTVAAIKSAFVDHSAELMGAILAGEDNQKYNGGFFLTKVEDSEYDYVRSMYKTIGVDTNAFVGN